MAFTNPSRPRPSRTLGEPMSALTVDLIRKGLEPPISKDGPHTISEARRWLARQLLDSKLSDAEVFGIVAHHPSIKQERAA